MGKVGQRSFWMSPKRNESSPWKNDSSLTMLLESKNSSDRYLTICFYVTDKGKVWLNLKICLKLSLSVLGSVSILLSK